MIMESKCRVLPGMRNFYTYHTCTVHCANGGVLVGVSELVWEIISWAWELYRRYSPSHVVFGLPWEE